MSHGNDCHWNSIHCRKCRAFVTEWYDKDFDSEPDNICDRCAIDEGKKNADKLLIERLKMRLHEMIVKYEPKRCIKCYVALPNPDKSLMWMKSEDPFTPYNDDPCEVCDKCPSWDPYTDY